MRRQGRRSDGQAHRSAQGAQGTGGHCFKITDRPFACFRRVRLPNGRRRHGPTWKCSCDQCPFSMASLLQRERYRLLCIKVLTLRASVVTGPVLPPIVGTEAAGTERDQNGKPETTSETASGLKRKTARNLLKILEAGTGIEPVFTDLQSAA